MSEYDNLGCDGHFSEPSGVLKDAASAMKRARGRMPALTECRDQQAEVVRQISVDLTRKLDERVWDREADPEKVRQFKLEVIDLSEAFYDERGMLNAIERAVVNLRDEIEAESSVVNTEVDKIATEAFNKTQRQLLNSIPAI